MLLAGAALDNRTICFLPARSLRTNRMASINISLDIQHETSQFDKNRIWNLHMR
jgi:hypothetical protein